MVLDQQWEKNIDTTINFGITKKQKMSPQKIYILVYKNAIVNKLRTS